MFIKKDWRILIMADIISYFGTYTPAADGAAASFEF